MSPLLAAHGPVSKNETGTWRQTHKNHKRSVVLLLFWFALVLPGQETSQDRCKASPHDQPITKDKILIGDDETGTSVHSTGNSNSLWSAVLSTPFLAVLSSVSHWTGVLGTIGRALVSTIGMPALLASNGILPSLQCFDWPSVTLWWGPSLSVSNPKPELCFCYDKTETTKKLYF